MESLYAEGFLVQEHITGTNASISLLASGSGAKLVSLNEQMLGIQEVYQREPFGYCGNVVPMEVDESTRRLCEHIIDEISSHFGLTGSNGVDMVIDEDGTPYVMEVNPRFQGSLECVERVFGVNLVEMHVDACTHGSIPEKDLKPKKFCTRLILYAPQRICAPDLMSNNLRDIPHPGEVIEEGEPLCSVISDGRSRNASLDESQKLAERIYAMMV
jgi:predicted ATP-grasp superfamily ATP-dependent carboligase